MSHGFLIDMDGVIYRGNQLIPGADRFVEHLLNDDVPFLFLTNNSQRTRRDVATKLRRMGIDGDTMETDILGGVQMGYRTVLVLTGSTGLADLDRYAYQPDVVVDSIADAMPLAGSAARDGAYSFSRNPMETVSAHG